MNEDRRDEMSRAVARMKPADVLRKYEQVASPVETKQPKVKMVTLGKLMDQWPKRKGER